MSGETDTRCLFFALWPDGPTREAIYRLQQTLTLRGRPVRRENIHLTLAFVGDVDSESCDCLLREARGVSAPPVDFILERVGYFPRPRVVWSGPGHTPDALIRLATSLSNALVPCGYTPEPRPYRAHVTLYRKVGRAPRPQTFDPIRWRADAFHLVESIPEQGGVRYAVLEAFPLAG